MDWKWTRAKEMAALLVAEDELSDEEIGARVGVTDRTLRNWKREPEFWRRVDEHSEAFRAVIERKAIAQRGRPSAHRRGEAGRQSLGRPPRQAGRCRGAPVHRCRP